jgi:hypothetical protein
LRFIGLFFLALLAFFGFSLVVYGTDATTAGRYLVPPQILPGLGVLYLCALLTAIATAKKFNASIFLMSLNKFISQKIGKTEREKLRNMFLLLTFFLIAFSMTSGTTPMYRALAANYLVSLLVNILVSGIASLGLLGWLSSLFISNQSKEKS